ncbi:hypothetical protein ABMA70_12745 [Halobacteriovorax sp. XZX-3]|uniref:hypothetical protein n=1 Tax=unclassified Halobacteriovorax TaxID=2639665 RepID=UPI0037183F5A
MKNRYLFVILVLSIFAAYFLVEKDEQKEVALITQKRNILSFSTYGKIKSITVAGNTIEIKEAIEDNLNLFYDELQKLKVDRILESDEVDENLLKFDGAETITFNFTSGKAVSFLVGKKIELNQSFYMAVIDGQKSTWLIARFETAFPADANDKNRDRSSIPYEKFREVLQTPKEFFYTKLKE